MKHLTLHPPNLMPQKFEFVNFNKPVEEQDAASRRRVREGAMRAFRRRERLQRIEIFEKTKTSSRASNNTQGLLISEPASTSGQPSTSVPNRASATCPNPVQLSPQSYESYDGTWILGTLDPCGTKSMGLSPTQHYLLNHFISLISSRPFRFTPKKENSIGTLWFRHVIQDRILLQATMLNAAVHLDSHCGRESTSLTLNHRAQTIRLVNESLNSPEGVSDSIIGAVVLLAYTGNYNGDHHEMQLHLDALAQMVRIRGGLENLGLDGFLETLITRLDLVAATMTNSEPRFSASQDGTFVEYNPTFDNSAAFCDLLQPIENNLGPLVTIFRDIRYLISMQDSFDSSDLENDHVMSFAQRRSSIFQRLLCNKFSPPPIKEDCAYLYEPCRIAALIFMEYTLARRTPSQAILRRFGSNLMDSLQKVVGAPGFQAICDRDLQFLEVLLWVYYMGGMASGDSVAMKWYASQISLSMPRLELHAWTELKSLLLQLLWTDTMHDQVCTALWQEIERHMAKDLG